MRRLRRRRAARRSSRIEAFGGDDADASAVADELERRVDALAAEAGPLVELAFSPHAPYTVGLALFAEIVARARARGMHVVDASGRVDTRARCAGAAAPASLARSVAPYGRHPILELAERGLLGPETVVAHAVHVGDEEIAALAASGAAVAHCPRSNALLGCGVAPLARLRAAGVRVGLGTDSPSSALSLDMFDELRAALLLARASAGDPEALSTASALQMATLDGARALGLDDRGALAPGHAGRPDRGAARRDAVLAVRRPSLGARPRRLPGARDAGRDRRQRAVRCGFYRIRTRPLCRGGCARPASSNRERLPT